MADEADIPHTKNAPLAEESDNVVTDSGNVSNSRICGMPHDDVDGEHPNQTTKISESSTTALPEARIGNGLQAKSEMEYDNPAHIYSCQSSDYIHQDTPAIYCYGPLLHEVQLSSVYKDSKTFVDMKMKLESEEILRKFRMLAEEFQNLSDADKVPKLTDFMNENLLLEGLVEWIPNDWAESPRFLESVTDSNLKKWGGELNSLWKKLGRKIDDDVLKNPGRHSAIHCSNPFVVPGGRFREFYYWDNYWINRGLLLCEMYETVKGTVRNFFEMVQRFGFVPNGGRIYYTRRSQLPFLSLMVRDYVEESGDNEFILEALPYLEQEYSFWEKHRTVDILDDNGQVHHLNRYASDVNQPRPESYKHDYTLIQLKGRGKDAKLKLMTHVTSACESGWDLSSRWTGLPYDGSEGPELLWNLKTRDIIPVDLNAILSVVERILTNFNEKIGDVARAALFKEKYQKRVEAMELFLWNEKDGSYYDYVVSTRTQNRQYFISNVTPLWTKSYPDNIDVAAREIAMYKYLKNQLYEGTSLLDFPGGIPVSLNNCGEQWDFPNAWPPCSHMVIEGMHTSEVDDLKKEGFRQAQKYVKTCWNGFTNNPNYKNAMFEKYCVLTDEGVPGEGGDYDVQEGFGWTNGVAIILLDAFGDTLSSKETDTTVEPETSIDKKMKNQTEKNEV